MSVAVNLNISGGALKSFLCRVMGHKYKTIYIPGSPMTEQGMIAHPVDVCLRCGQFKGLPMTYEQVAQGPGLHPGHRALGVRLILSVFLFLRASQPTQYA